MEIISVLALILLTLVGYSSGAVLGAKGRTAMPGIADLLVVIVLWIGAIATRGALGKWLSIGVWLGVGLVVGAILTWARAGIYSKIESQNVSSGFWNVWKNFLRKVGDYQGRVLMSLLYFTIILPFGFVVSIFADPLNIKKTEDDSTWQPRETPHNPSIEEARKQF